jgi:hypothetical protein
MRTLITILALLLSPLPAAAWYLGPVVYESPREQQANLNTGKKQLTRLQQAAKVCHSMRLYVIHGPQGPIKPQRLTLSDYDINQLRRLIADMSAVKQAPSLYPYSGVNTRLELLDAKGRCLAQVLYTDVVSQNMLSSQGYAEGARLCLSPTQAAAWHVLMKVSSSRSIALQPNPTEPPEYKEPYEIATTPERDLEAENRLEEEIRQREQLEGSYHRNCRHKHKSHSHEGRDHHCKHH